LKSAWQIVHRHYFKKKKNQPKKNWQSGSSGRASMSLSLSPNADKKKKA
jgi:hypothetical protein